MKAAPGGIIALCVVELNQLLSAFLRLQDRQLVQAGVVRCVTLALETVSTGTTCDRPRLQSARDYASSATPIVVPEVRPA